MQPTPISACSDCHAESDVLTMSDDAAKVRRWRARPESWWWISAVVLLPVVLLTGVSVVVLSIVTHPTNANDQINLVKTALSVGAGTGGVVALVLAGRRQWSTEEANRASAHDAAERRVTELYTKAADQLGSDKAPVRLAGLYALERLAQDNEGQRQTIVNLICAYLRVPFEPPDRNQRPGPQFLVGQPPLTTEANSDRSGSQEELLVRKTAQSILADHLYVTDNTLWPRQPAKQPGQKYWPDIELHLSGATLIDFTLQGRVSLCDFSNARFIGGSNFAHVAFDDHVYFRNARFENGSAHFYGALFGLRAVFSGTDFGSSEVIFEGATFCGMVFLDDAKFGGGITLEGARALASFNTSWGSQRLWPAGWHERRLQPGERPPHPQYGRWSKRSAAPEANEGEWALVERTKPIQPSVGG